jgi:pyruvate carboxylase
VRLRGLAPEAALRLAAREGGRARRGRRCPRSSRRRRARSPSCTSDGVATNVPFLRNLLRHPALATYGVTTRFVDEHVAELAGRRGRARPAARARRAGRSRATRSPCSRTGRPRRRAPRPQPDRRRGVGVGAPMQGTVVAVDVAAGDEVPPARSSSSWRR